MLNAERLRHAGSKYAIVMRFLVIYEWRGVTHMQTENVPKKSIIFSAVTVKLEWNVF